MAKFDFQNMFRQAHIKLFNPPYAQSSFQAEDDPDRLRKMAFEMISAGRPGDFLGWISSRCPDWQDNDLALHLVGQTLKLAEKPEEAKKCLSVALDMRKLKGEALQIASTLLALSEVARFQEDNELAWSYLNEAVELYPTYRSTHLNRFCLASLAQDLSKLTQLFQEMQTLYPNWTSDIDLIRGLKEDGELVYLRESELWQEILASIQTQENSIHA